MFTFTPPSPKVKFRWVNLDPNSGLVGGGGRIFWPGQSWKLRILARHFFFLHCAREAFDCCRCDMTREHPCIWYCPSCDCSPLCLPRWPSSIVFSSKGGSNIWRSRCYVMIDRTRQRRRHFSVSLLYFSKVGARHLSSPSTITRLAAANCRLARSYSSSF